MAYQDIQVYLHIQDSLIASNECEKTHGVLLMGQMSTSDIQTVSI